MSTPFFRGFDRYDLFTAALVCRSMNYGSANDAATILRGVQAGFGRSVPADPSTPGALCYITPDYVFVAIAGTESWGQWVCNVLGSVQAAQPGIPGSVAVVFWAVASAIWNKLEAFAHPHLAGRKLVLIGHSLGGAAVQVLLPIMQAAGAGEASVFAFGAPRVGNPAFAAAVAPIVKRVETTNDPIVGVPPTTWAGADSRFPIPGIPPVAIYTQAGPAQTIDAYGEVVSGGNGITLGEVIQAWSVWDAPTHGTEIYVSRLSVGLALNPIPPEVGYADGTLIGSAFGLYSDSPAIQEVGGGVAYLTQGIMYFRSNNGPQEGWEEAAYFSSEVPAVLTLLKDIIIPKRTACMSKQAEIHAYRAARADGQRLSKTNKPLAPFVGQLSDPVNEFGDCIDYELRNASGARRLWAFRAIPDGWIEGKKLSADGVAGTGLLDSFSNELINRGGSLKVPFNGNLYQQPIIMANNPAAGGPIQITTAQPHGLQSGDIINLTKMTGYPYLRDQWKISIVDNLNFKLVGSQRYNINVQVEFGQFQKIEYVPSALTSFTFNNVGFRKTGTPFGMGRGKRSAVTLHH